MYEELTAQAKQAVTELLDVAKLKPGKLFVIGCSSSEMVGARIGKGSSLEAAQAAFAGIYPVLQLRDGIDDLKAVRLGHIALNNKRAVEVLAALHGKFNAALLQNGIDARECGLRSLEARALADARADHLT